MARKTVYVDDIDGSEIADGEGGPVDFAFGGKDYRIDLSAKNLAKMEKALAPFIEKAAEVEPEPAITRSRGPKTTTKRTSAGGSGADKEQLKAMREWLRKQGHEVSDRGRIAQNLQDLYHQAHG